MPPLGWISPKDRTSDQHNAHARAVGTMVAFTLPPTDVPKGTKVLLTDLWRAPEVVADIGFEFTGFGQYTGSCVGVSAGNAVATVSFVQRRLATTPTKAMVPWWPFNYGRTRFNEGDRGQGAGAVDSVMGQTLAKEGVFDIAQPGLPAFGKTGPNGLWLSEGLEYQWSDGARIDGQWITLAKEHPVGGIAPLSAPVGIKTSLVNGYPVLDGCELYVGEGSIRGEGENAYVRGRYDNRGGHSTCLAPDTKVSLLDGTEKTVREMAESGQEYWVYSCEDGRVVPKPARAAMTRRTVPEGMVRVTLDNGETVTTTPDHKFMLRDGRYAEAKDLRAGDSLMPLYRKLSDTKRHPGYEMVLDPGPMTWELTHRRVAESTSLLSVRLRAGTLVAGELPIDCRPVIHHADFNKRNNVPQNLMKMVSREHWRHHSAVAEGVWERMDPMTAAARKSRMSAWVKALWADPDYREMMRQVSVTSIKKLWKFLRDNPELYAAHVARSAEHLKNLWADPEFRARKIAQTRELMSSPAVRKRLAAINRKKAKDPEFLSRLSAGAKKAWVEAEPEARARRVAAMTATRQSAEYKAMMAEAQKKRFADPEARQRHAEAIRKSWAKRKAATPNNHKVASILFLPNETGPVYCLEIPGTHNFAVAAGVFVHNCFLGYWEHPTDGPLYLYSNQWPTSTYPKDPAGGGRCCVWLPESEVEKLFTRYGGDNGETMALSHLNWFPAQPEVLNWIP